jgi:replicative DNA helicase
MQLSAPIYELKRRAKQLARAEKLPLHQALDQVARAEGFAAWSLLAARATAREALPVGELVLVGGRPGHGKTRFALRLLLDAAGQGRKALFFTLDYTDAQATALLNSVAAGLEAPLPDVHTSDEISAAYILRHMSGLPTGTVAVIDYLQALDHARSKPPLAEQLRLLQDHARISGHTLCFISQIDRNFTAAPKQTPDMGDLRQPNPVPIEVFKRAWFLHAGAIGRSASA